MKKKNHKKGVRSGHFGPETQSVTLKPKHPKADYCPDLFLSKGFLF